MPPAERLTEISWFAALCDDDYEFLGVPDPNLASSWEHCLEIVASAERLGFDNVLLPSGYGIDPVAFAGGVAALTERIRLLVAVRCGGSRVPRLANQLATLDRMLAGRLTINIISSDVPGEQLDPGPRYRRTLETMIALRTLLDGDPLDIDGEFIRLKIEPPRITTCSGRCPPLYFAGFSDEARAVAAEAADVYLMWPESEAGATALIADLTARADRGWTGLGVGRGRRAALGSRSPELRLPE